MATKSFLKNITIKSRTSANAFINALENAEGKGRKKVKIDKSVETVKNNETIRKIFTK